VQAELWRYVDRELSAREFSEISESLRRCESCRRAYEERTREVRLLRAAFIDAPFSAEDAGDRFCERFRERLRAAGLDRLERSRRASGRRTSGSGRSGVGWGGAGRGGDGDGAGDGAIAGTDELEFEGLVHLPRTSPQRRRRILTVAAMLLVIPTIVGVGIYLSGERSIGTYTAKGNGTIEVLEDGSTGLASEVDPEGGSRVLRAGTLFRVPKGMSVELKVGEEGTAGRPPAAHLTVTGPAEFEVASVASTARFRGLLSAGELHAVVAERREGESFFVSTRDYAVSVIGTEFTLIAEDGSATLEVHAGKVAFGTPSGDGSLVGEEVVDTLRGPVTKGRVTKRSSLLAEPPVAETPVAGAAAQVGYPASLVGSTTESAGGSGAAGSALDTPVGPSPGTGGEPATPSERPAGAAGLDQPSGP
jgi:hypothetical protein